MSTQTDVLIVGGGIGGIATALACAQAGREVIVLERAAKFAEVGAGLQIGPNGARVLRRLGILDRLLGKAVFPARISICDINSQELLTYMDLGEHFQAHFGECYMVMHRSDLLEALLDAARAMPNIELLNGKLVETISIGDQAPAVLCADGTRYRGRILVGADGGMSRVRQALVGETPMECDGYVAFRGTIPIETIPQHAGNDNVVLYTGEAVHLVQYPVRGGKLYNQVAVFQSKNYDPNKDAWGWGDELDVAFEGTHDYVRSSVARVSREFRWPLRDRSPMKQWHRNHAVLIGDAAHPMYQYLAQGACQALEDAVVLAQCLADTMRPASECLEIFVGRRLLRTARVQLTARSFGRLIHLGGLEQEVRDAVFKARNPRDYTTVDWLYGDHGYL